MGLPHPQLNLLLLLELLALNTVLAGPIHDAAEKGDGAYLSQLLSSGTHPDEVDESQAIGVTALHIVARHGHDALMRQLLAAGADPNSLDKVGWTALHEAAGEGHRSAVKMLLAAGTDPTFEELEDSKTALQFASKCFSREQNGLPSIVFWPMCNTSVPRSRYGHEEILEMLVEARDRNEDAVHHARDEL